MKKFLTLLLALFFFIPQAALAQYSPSQNVLLPQNEVVDRDYFASGNLVTLSGTVNGDAYIAAGTVVVDGTINGDLLVAGGTVDIRGKVRDNVRAVGGQVTVSGEVGRNVSIASGSLNITEPGRVGGSLAAAGGSLVVSAPVTQEANLAGGQIVLNNSVGKNVNAAGEVSLSSKAQIGGDLNYWSTNQVQLSPGSQIAGRTIQNMPPQPTPKDTSKILGIFTGFQLLTTIMFLLSYLIGGLLLLRFVPFFIQRGSQFVLGDFWKSLIIGLLILILVPLIAFILLITVLGIPLAFLIMGIYFIAIYFGKIMVFYALGQKILNTKNPTVWGLILGLIIYGILVLIPLIGGLVILIAISLGLGALFQERRDFISQVRAKKLM